MTRPKQAVVIAAHRGMAAGYPENTLAAFRHSVSAGFPVIEVDLRATADGHIVIMHDETVDRTTSGTGEVGRMTLAEVRSLDAGSHAGPRFAGEPVPTYPETLEAGIIRLWPQWILDSGQDAPPEQSPLVQRLHDLGKSAWVTADTLHGDISQDHPREDLTELVRLGIDGITTNLPELLRDVLAAE